MVNLLKTALLLAAFAIPRLLSAQSSAPVLYTHFDKNSYSTNENVWFTAYLYNRDQQRATTDFIVALLVDH